MTTLSSKMPLQHWIIRPDGVEFPLHTYPWLKEINTRGLGIPRMNNDEDIVLEKGAREHGSRAVLMKLPETRLWSLEFRINETDVHKLEEEVEDILFDMFNPLYAAYGQFNVPDPWIYKRVSSGGRTRMIRFFLEAGLDVENVIPGYPPLRLDMTSPQVYLFGSEIDEGQLGGFVLDHTDAFGNKYYESVQSFVYDGTWVTCPRFTVALTGDGDQVLSRIGWKNMDTGVSYFMSHYDWRNGNGWIELRDAVTSVTLDICNNTFYTSQVENALDGGATQGDYTINVVTAPYAAQVGALIEVEMTGSPHYSTIVDADTVASTITMKEPIPTTVLTGYVKYGPVNLSNFDVPRWDEMQLVPGLYFLWYAMEAAFTEETVAEPEIGSFVYEPHYIGIYR